MRPVRRSLLALVGLVVPTFAFAPVGAERVPEQVPDRLPVLSESLHRGDLVREDVAPRPPVRKSIDGLIDDWVGEPARVGGTSRFHTGEHIYSDFVHDAWGADDGDDATRRTVTGPLSQTENRAGRGDAASQAAGDQFGAPRPAGSPDHYGDQPHNGVADIAEVRWAADGDDLDLLVRVTSLEDPDDLAIGLHFDRDGDDATDLYLILGSQGQLHNFVDGPPLAVPVKPEIAVNAEGWTNAFEVRLPAQGVAPDDTLRVAVVAGAVTADGVVFANQAYRDDEPINGMYNDLEQALALHDGSLDHFRASIDLADLRAGRTEAVRPDAGYHERVFLSDPGISEEGGENTLWQRYALFVPTAYEPGTPNPLTFWLHYRGGKAHSGGAWSPRLFTQLGEEQGNIVVTPHARGTSKWYEGDSHQDFFEVFEDVHATFDIDPRRRYLSGYSMGGYGTALFGLLYPDLFAAGYVQSAAISATQRDLADNARHFPLWIDHGAQDELVPITGLQELALRLRDLGYRYTMTTFVAAEHYTQAILDEWAGGARYLNQFTTPDDPRHVTYKVIPSLLEAIHDGRGSEASATFEPDGAWWIDDIDLRDGDEVGMVDAEASSLPASTHDLAPTASVFAPLDYSTPFVQHGQAWTTTGAAPLGNSLTATLTNVAHVSIDVSRLDLDLVEGAETVVDTDGATAVTFTGLPTGAEVLVDDLVFAADGSDITIDLGEGTHQLLLRS